MGVYYKSEAVPEAVENSLSLARPVGTLVLDVNGVLWRSTSGSAATYVAVDVAGTVDIGSGDILDFGDGDATFTPDGTNVQVAGTGKLWFDDDVFAISDTTDPTKTARFDVEAVATGTERTITIPDVNLDLGHVVRRAFVTVPGGDGAGNVGDLATTPVEVIAAPGADEFIEVVSAHFFLDYESVTYDGAATTTLRYTNGAGAAVLNTPVPAASLITSAVDAHVVTPAIAENVVPVAAAAIVVDCSVDPYTGAGNSPLLIEVFYRVRDLTPA